MKNKNRIISLFLTIIMSLILIISSVTPVFATDSGPSNDTEDSASDRQANFLNYYADSAGMTLEADNLSAKDYYVLYAFLSNYFQPGVTTLNDLTSPEGTDMYTKFSTAMGKSNDTQLLKVIQKIGEDTEKGIETGKCTIVDASGTLLSGADFMDTMRQAANLSETAQTIVSQKVYFEKQDAKHVAFDFSSPAVKAAFSVLAAYNSDMLMSNSGIYSLDALFLDAVGNLWGVEAGDKASELAKTTNLSRLVTTLGAENVYLILPACLNPSAFTVNASSQLDLKMPLMNRFVLGCLTTQTAFSGKNGVTFSNDNIPFYNLLSSSNIGAFSSASNGLTVFGVQTLSPYTGNFGLSSNKTGIYSNSWSQSEKQQDIANFIYNSQSIILNKSISNGIGKFGTNSFIMFTPNINQLKQNGSEPSKDSLEKNFSVDMKTWGFFSQKSSFDIYNEDYKKQLQLLYYLYTPTILDLNHVAMNFYYTDDSKGSNASGYFADYMKGSGDSEDLLISKMGMRGLSLFMSMESDDKIYEGEEYKVMIADSMIHSKFIQTLSSLGDSLEKETYLKIKNTGNLEDLAGLSDTNAINILKDVLSSNFTLSNWDGFGISESGSSKTWNYNIKPEGFTNFGNNNTDLGFAPTLCVNDTEIRNKFASLHDVGGQSISLSVSLSDAQVVKNLITGLYGYSLFFPSEIMMATCSPSSSLDSGTLFGQDSSKYKSTIPLAEFNNQDFVMGIYFGYIIDMLGLNSCDANGITFGEFNTGNKFLPKYSISANGADMSFEGADTLGSGVVNSEDLSFEEKQKDLINRIYGLTNDKNNDYRNNLIKNIIEGFVLTVHRTITGTWGSDIASVSTGNSSTYQSVTGYIYTPTLEELSFTSTLMNNYIKVYIFCMLVVLFMLVLMVLLHMRTWQQGLSICLIMFVALLFPYILISNTVSISNKVSDSIYSDRFDFWAMSQYQQRLISLNNTSSLDEKETLLALSNATADLTYNGETGVKIKWMSPKKVEMFTFLYSDPSLSQSFVTNIKIFKWLFNSFIYDSEFVDTDVYGSYVYRPYNSIALEGKAYYAWGKSLQETSEYNSKITYISENTGNYTFNNIPKPFVDTLEKLKANGKDYAYIAALARIDKDYYSSSSSVLSYSNEKLEDLDIISQRDTMGVSEKADVIGIWSSLNADITERITGNTDIAGINSNLPSLADEKTFTKDSDYRQISKALFLKNTESPYYYFYSVLKARYSEDSEYKKFKKALLKNEIFKVKLSETDILNSQRNVNNEFRDFLDLEGLFTYVIPYMHDSNVYVSEWQKNNDSTIEEYNFKYSPTPDGLIDTDTLEIKDAEDDKVAYGEAVKKKNNINRVWNMYCPWVDSLYDLNIKNKKVSVGGKSIIIPDTLNPSSYILNGRPMIFSEADMTIKGYTYKDLTDVERRIQAVTEKTYEDLMYLVNYYDMEDEVLLSAAAMYATFNFNTEFSQNSFMGNSIMLYPHGFELKNFNYDAFMRLALLNSTGETVFATEDLYTRVLAKTSIFSGLLLLISDVLACIAIPMVKFVILSGLLFLGILICIACVVNPPDKIFESVCKSLLLPTLMFMVLNISFSWVMSLIVGEGLTTYVGSKTVNFATNDPTITIFIMSLVGCTYLFVAWKILKFLIAAYKQFGLSTALATVGIIGAALSSGASGIARKGAKITGSGIGAGIGALTAGKGNRLGGAFEGAQSGAKGVINNRIHEKRAAKDFAEATGHVGDTGLSKKVDELSKTTGSGDDSSLLASTTDSKLEKVESSSELDRPFEKATDKKANKGGRMLSNLSYAKAKVQDTVSGLDYKRIQTGYALKNLKMDVKEKVRNTGDTIKGTPLRTKKYLNNSLNTLKNDNQYYDLVRKERNNERMGQLMGDGKDLAVRKSKFKEDTERRKDDKKRRVDVAY